MFLNYLKTNESSLPVQLERSTAELDEVGNEQVFIAHSSCCSFMVIFLRAGLLSTGY